MDKKYIIPLGMTAGTFTSFAFIPQVYKIYKTKDTRSLSIVTIIIFIIGQMLWSLYGYLSNDKAIVIFCSINFCLYLYILYAKIVYEKNNIH